MKYEFPIITHIDKVIAAVQDREEIIVAPRDHFTVVNYLVAFTDTFPDPLDTCDEDESLRRAIRRECRGLKFDNETGELMARPYHKFFNFGEKEETQHHNIDWNSNFTIFDKMDGSMIHPVLYKGDVIYCTRMGATDVAENAQVFADNHSTIHYNGFSTDMIQRGLTPIFEWCSRKNRIVLLYPEDVMVLTGLRDMVTGIYMLPDEMATLSEKYNIPIVKQWQGTFGDIESFVADTVGLIDEEGYVFRWDTGAMGKGKNDWYVQIHRAKDQIRFEKDVIRMFLEGNMDDVLPHVMAEDKVRLESFTADLTEGIEDSVVRIHGILDGLHDSVKDVEDKFKRRDMAAAITKYDQPIKSLLFQSLDGSNVTANVIKRILDKTNSSSQVDSVRVLFGIDWDDY